MDDADFARPEHRLERCCSPRGVLLLVILCFDRPPFFGSIRRAEPKNGERQRRWCNCSFCSFPLVLLPASTSRSMEEQPKLVPLAAEAAALQDASKPVQTTAQQSTSRDASTSRTATEVGEEAEKGMPGPAEQTAVKESDKRIRKWYVQLMMRRRERQVTC